VVVDTERATVHGEFVMPGSPMTCTSDANPEAYVVAIERDRLPDGPFAVQLHAEDPPPGAPEERTLVHVDLREPGSVATDDEIGPDQALIDEPERYVITAGGFVEPDFPAYYDLELSCSFGVLGPFNGVVWESSTPDLHDSPPAAWVDAAEDGVVEVELLLQTDPARLQLTANGHTEHYVPSEEGSSACP
jgi:hypothetical protein